jgi:hypothetical protein
MAQSKGATSIDDVIKMKEFNKGFTYTLVEEKIIEYMRLSTEEKLTWLEEIDDFANTVLSDREKELREKLRACEI